MDNWFKYIIIAFIVLAGVYFAFIIGFGSGLKRGATLHYQGEWTCEVALGEVHCGPVEED